jgi:hypothetical protein
MGLEGSDTGWRPKIAWSCQVFAIYCSLILAADDSFCVIAMLMRLHFGNHWCTK